LVGNGRLWIKNGDGAERAHIAQCRDTDVRRNVRRRRVAETVEMDTRGAMHAPLVGSVHELMCRVSKMRPRHEYQ
jgi:hypothetical protein